MLLVKWAVEQIMSNSTVGGRVLKKLEEGVTPLPTPCSREGNLIDTYPVVSAFCLSRCFDYVRTVGSLILGKATIIIGRFPNPGVTFAEKKIGRIGMILPVRRTVKFLQTFAE